MVRNNNEGASDRRGKGAMMECEVKEWMWMVIEVAYVIILDFRTLAVGSKMMRSRSAGRAQNKQNTAQAGA